MERKTISVEIEGKEIFFETGKVARQANGSVFVHCNDTSILATACAKKEPLEDVDFLPLRVDYQAKFSSIGKTVSGFIKREGRPNQEDILISRYIDRTLRPLFPEGYYHDVQVFSYVYSFDGQCLPDVLGICAASAALVISDIPLLKPVGAVRVGLIDDNFIVNPTTDEKEKSKLDLVLAGTEDAILMIEGFCDFLTEEEVLAAIEYGHKAIIKICKTLSAWQKEIGKEKNVSKLAKISDEVKEDVSKIAKDPIIAALKIADKQKREEAFEEITKKVHETLLPESEPKYPKRDVKIAFKKLSSTLMRDLILKDNKRIDGRKTNEIRPIDIEPSFLKRTHGSALFTRGETQAIAVCTLGGETMAQRYEDLHGDSSHRFYLQYFFPPFSVGEVGRSGPPGRREVGHGKLAEKALMFSLPKQEDFPYVIRLESNITESNGSSSMASVCGGCLALMDAGVPIKRPVSGIAMGLVLEGDKAVILSDILGAEDALGDMDFKITGDDKGITAFQMDIKVEGITHPIMEKALMQAKEGRIHILGKMNEAMPTFKQDLSIYAPRIEVIKVKQSQIGTIIGPGGKQIRAIIEETGVEIDINDEGIVNISSTDGAAMKRAKEIVFGLTAEVEKGKTYDGKVVSIVPFGLFLEILPGKEGLCHISEISMKRIDDVSKLFKVGDKLKVKVIDINDRGQVKLSHRVLLEEEEKNKNK
jgi:polyribonucleotide nucleotidyltransferase